MSEVRQSILQKAFVTFSVSMPRVLVAQLDEIARVQYSSRGAVVRQLVDMALAQRRRDQAAAEAAR